MQNEKKSEKTLSKSLYHGIKYVRAGNNFKVIATAGGEAMQYNRVEICGVNTAKLKVLKEKEKMELLKEMSEGSSKAREDLIQGNLRLVLSVVQRFTNRGENPDDLFQVGCIGLIKAIDTFNPDNGTRFATYAGKCMQNEILMYFRSRKRVSCEASINDAIEFDKDGNPMTYLDILCVDDDIIDKIDIKCKGELAIKGIRVCLTARERDIIIARYGLSGEKPITQREVAKNLGISRSYVSRLEKSAIEKLREFMERPGNFL